jgi:isopentenyl diphosphate isomerase/L-lactate dehydrogenase-like FMN-dependent dehydrogenase
MFASAASVARVLEILRYELMSAMALTGRTSIAEIDGSVLWDNDETGVRRKSAWAA